MLNAHLGCAHTRVKQLSFLPKMHISTSLAYGGNTGRGKRKTARPFDPKRPLHVVLRSSRATKQWSMLKPRHRAWIEDMLKRCSKQYGIKIHRFVNVGNHLHLLLSADGRSHECAKSQRYTRARADLAAFLRHFAGSIAFHITGASKSNPVGRFWDELVYSRIVSLGREFETVMRYLIKNIFEAEGLWNRKKHPEWELISFHCLPAD